MKSRIAADQIWQFGPASLSADLASFGDKFSVYVNDNDFEEVGRARAREMLDNVVVEDVSVE